MGLLVYQWGYVEIVIYLLSLWLYIHLQVELHTHVALNSSCYVNQLGPKG